MQLSDFGKIGDTEWRKSFEIRNELLCDEYIIMPNHLHAIIILNNDNDNDNDKIKNMADDYGNNDDIAAQTHGRASLPSSCDLPISSDNPPSLHRLPKSISSFIARLKSAVNSKIDDFIDANNLDIPKYNHQNHFFQPNYHDIIIENEISYYHIKNYIICNPKNWNADKFKN